MVTRKSVNQDEKPERQDFNLFDAISAIDRKDYGYWDTLTIEQQRKFIPYMLLQWMSSVRGSADLQRYYLNSFDHVANKYMFNEAIQRNSKLQWLMLCAASPGIGKQQHQWIPQLNKHVSKLEERCKLSDVKEYYAKIYSGAESTDIAELAGAFVKEQHGKVYLAKNNPTMKLEDIEVLSKLVTPAEIEQYEKDIGN